MREDNGSATQTHAQRGFCFSAAVQSFVIVVVSTLHHDVKFT